jgi:hypothetical protein
MRKIKITSDGTTFGTKVIDVESGDMIEGVVRVRWSMTMDGARTEAEVGIEGIPVEIEAAIEVPGGKIKAENEVQVELQFEGGAIEIGHLPEDLAALETIVVSRHDESRGGIHRNYRMRRLTSSFPRDPGTKSRIVFREIEGQEPGPEIRGIPWS